MKQLNSLYNTNGNKSLDDLLFHIENLDILSVNFKNAITALCVAILINYEGNGEKGLKEEVDKIVNLMKNSVIFHLDYLDWIYMRLSQGIAFERMKAEYKVSHPV